MRKTSVALITTLLISAGSAHAAEPAKVNPKVQAGPAATVGGFAQAKDDAPELRAARNLAVAELIRRKGANATPNVVREEVQVVAGMNFRFLIKTAQGPVYEVVVFRPLQGAMTVTKFEPRR